MTRLAKIIRLAEQGGLNFSVEDAVAEFSGRADLRCYTPEPDYDSLTSFYGLTPSKFREKVASLINPEDLVREGIINLKLNWVTSIDILAANKRIIPRSFSPVAAIGVVKTKDSCLLLGIRGGKITPERTRQFASGLYATVLGGSVKFKLKYEPDPVSNTLTEEFKEEIGDFEIGPTRLLGVFEAYEPGPIGIKFVGELVTDATFQQIQETNILANQLYSLLISKGAKRLDVIGEMKSKRLPPDAWENFPIIGIPNNSEAIKHFVITQYQSFSGIGAGALELYLEDYKRRQK